MKWHYRFGHDLNFVCQEKTAHSQFINKRSNAFSCEIRQLSKHTRSSFPSRPYRKSKPYALFHSDIWGPSWIPNVTRARWFVLFVNDHTRLT